MDDVAPFQYAEEEVVFREQYSGWTSWRTDDRANEKRAFKLCDHLVFSERDYSALMVLQIC